MDLIQDLRFETATTKIKATPDGEFLIASGVWEFRFQFLVYCYCCVKTKHDGSTCTKSSDHGIYLLKFRYLPSTSQGVRAKGTVFEV